MTLREIMSRLEEIEKIQCWSIDGEGAVHIVDTWNMEQAINELRLDIERYLLKTEGTL